LVWAYSPPSCADYLFTFPRLNYGNAAQRRMHVRPEGGTMLEATFIIR
jgi:hypothetical protein